MGTVPNNRDGLSVSTAAIDAAKDGTRDLIAAPGTGKSLWILGLYAKGSAGDGTAKFQDGAGTPVAMTGLLPGDIDASPEVFNCVSSWPTAPLFKCTSNMKFQVVLTANMDLDGWVMYATVAD